MTTAIDRRCLSPKRQLLCSRENALRVASRIFDHSQGKVCAKLFPIWTVVIDHLPAQLSLESPWFHVDFLAQIGLER